jgi:ABC-type Fe3+/spermidine/putrescine transport system ATPase subunit
LRDEIRDLQRRLGITTIYVTHDQEEALVISDRICVMQGGRVHQVAPARRVYGRPATLFVGSFVGTMNVFERVPVGAGGDVTIGARRATCRAAGQLAVTLAVRPEDVVRRPERNRRDDRARRHGRQGDLRRREAFYRWPAATAAHAGHVYRPDPEHCRAGRSPAHRDSDREPARLRSRRRTPHRARMSAGRASISGRW